MTTITVVRCIALGVGVACWIIGWWLSGVVIELLQRRIGDATRA